MVTHPSLSLTAAAPADPSLLPVGSACSFDKGGSDVFEKCTCIIVIKCRACFNTLCMRNVLFSLGQGEQSRSSTRHNT